ncbi:MAG: elongation factor P [Candidatus Omnitrophica bacterium]|nr:elongation factor P [Candidatus Omnitrophota bacterium]
MRDIKTGLTLDIDGQVYVVVEFQHVKPGKGSAFMRTKLRNLCNNSIKELTLRPDTRLEEAYVEQRRLQYLYRESQLLHFIDQDSFEEVTLEAQNLGEDIGFLKDNLEVNGYFYKGRNLFVKLPNFIKVRVIYSEPGCRADTVKQPMKSVTIETGTKVPVPLFIEVGDIIKIDTRSGEYIERV